MFERVDPLTLKSNTEMESQADPNMGNVDPSEWRGDLKEELARIEGMPDAELSEVPGPGGPIPLALFKTPNPRGVVFNIHGGGWFFGAHVHAADMAERYADRVHAASMGLGYRLAPEHPYPAAPDDCEAALLWLIENAKKVFGTEKIALRGDSAGAHLAAVTACRMRDKHGYTGLSGIVLVSGIYDLRLSPSARFWQERKLIWNGEVLANAVRWFAGNADKDDPDVSPIFHDLTGMPPALFIVGTDEALIDDSLFLQARWRLAGAEADLHVVPGGPHDPYLFGTPDSDLCIATEISFLSKAFG